MTYIRTILRRFWRKLLRDLESGNYISDKRANLAFKYCGSWRT